MDYAQIREFTRRASGNELKILLAIRHLEDNGLNSSADDISAEAMINRSTVYRLLPRLAQNQWIQYRLTADGRLMTEFALTELSRPAIVHITDTAGPSPECLPSNDPRATGVAKSDGPHRVNPSQNATESHSETRFEHKPASQQLTGTKDSNKGYASPYVRQAKDLARLTAKELNDQHSIGQHTQLWYQALELDEQTGTVAMRDTLLSITSDLRNRMNQNGRHQGAAFTNRVKAAIRTAREHYEQQQRTRQR